MEITENKPYPLIRKWESYSGKAYRCPAGIWTIGYGNTFYKDGSKVKEGDTITQDEAEDLLVWYCDNHIKLPKGHFTLEQKDCLYSLIYNIGLTAFNKSKCKQAIESEDWQTAYDNWWWVKANGKVLSGLIKRRQEERDLFFKDLL
jgi:lysozyme